MDNLKHSNWWTNPSLSSWGEWTLHGEWWQAWLGLYRWPNSASGWSERCQIVRKQDDRRRNERDGHGPLATPRGLNGGGNGWQGGKGPWECESGDWHRLSMQRWGRRRRRGTELRGEMGEGRWGWTWAWWVVVMEWGGGRGGRMWQWRISWTPWCPFFWEDWSMKECEWIAYERRKKTISMFYGRNQDSFAQ